MRLWVGPTAGESMTFSPNVICSQIGHMPR